MPSHYLMTRKKEMKLQAESPVTGDKEPECFLAALLNWSSFIEKARTLAIVELSKGR